MNPPASGRFEYLDAVRALAAFAVMFQHTFERISPEHYRLCEDTFNPGVYGVTLFFLASGVIIPRSASRAGLGRFWIGRFFRLFPLYWLTIVAAVSLQGVEYRWVDIVANLTMLQEYMHVPHILGVYWSLGVEMLFYVLCSIVLFAPLSRRIPISYLPVIAVVGFIAISMVSISTGTSLPLGRIHLIFASFLGIHFCDRRWLSRTSLGKVAWISVVAFSLVLAATIRFYLAPETPSDSVNFSHAGSIIAAWFAAYATFLVLFYLQDRKFPRWLLWLGTTCYSTYLLHPFALMLIPAHWSLSLQFPSVAMATYLLASASWVWFEKPMISLGKKIANRT